MALLTTLRRMKRDDITAHGFHSTFSDWASEVKLISPSGGLRRERALAHMIQNKAERADRRGDALEKRRQMMEAPANSPSNRVNSGPSAPADPTRSIGAETIDERR